MRERIAILGVFGLATTTCFACCGVSSGKPVEFFGQRNIIVWDAATKTEDFIRSAQFRSEAKDFGFIAPTPTFPELSLAKPAAFNFLDGLDPRPRAESFGGGGGGFGGGAGFSTPPVVLQVKEVGKYLATTLRATDSQGLADWMKENGYVTTTQIREWTEFYIRKSWLLTCFKVINETGDAQTGVIKMRFRTPVPFNPFYVPSENGTKSDNSPGLTVHLISADPLIPRFKPGPNSFQQRWAVRMSDQEAQALVPMLNITELPRRASVQYFVDKSFPHPSIKDDLFFDEGPRRIAENPLLDVFSQF
jgi:hypothetical protein